MGRAFTAPKQRCCRFVQALHGPISACIRSVGSALYGCRIVNEIVCNYSGKTWRQREACRNGQVPYMGTSDKTTFKAHEEMKSQPVTCIQSMDILRNCYFTQNRTVKFLNQLTIRFIPFVLQCDP